MTLKAALGIAASDDDDGGSADKSPSSYITEDQVGELVALIEDVGADKIKFLKHIKVESLAEIPAKQFQSAVDALNAKRGR
jgi:hypothetical protein